MANVKGTHLKTYQIKIVLTVHIKKNLNTPLKQGRKQVLSIKVNTVTASNEDLTCFLYGVIMPMSLCESFRPLKRSANRRST